MRVTASRVFALLIAASFVLAIVSGWFFGTDFRQLVTVLFAEACLIFLSAIIVERSLLSEADRRAEKRTRNLAHSLETSVKAVIQNSLNDAKYAAQYGVHLLPPRRSSRKNRDVTYRNIHDAIISAKWIKVFCTSGADIFPAPNAQVPSDSIAIAIMERMHSKMLREFSITVLSSEPGGQYAKLRGTIENPTVPNFIESDVKTAIASLRTRLAASTVSTTCKWFTYDFTPQAWFLLTDTLGFVETYHFGLGRRSPNDPNSCIGGRVPILELTSDGGMYKALNEYFDFLTGGNSDPRIDALRQSYFKIQEYAIICEPTSLVA